MAESSSSVAQRQRRANWVALRTLHQLPKLVGQTKDGHPVYEVRSVRLVLRPEASRFKRLVECSKCGDEVAGSSVTGPDALDRVPSPVICRKCVAESSRHGVWRLEESAPVPEPEVEVEEADDQADSDVEAIDRLELVEAGLDAVTVRLDEVAEAAAHRDTAPVAADLETLRQAVTDARADMAKSAEESGARLSVVEGQVRQGLTALADLIDGQRGDINAVAATMAEIRGEIERVSRSQRELAEANEAAQLLGGLGDRADGDEVAAAVISGVERRIEELHAELATLAATHGDELRAELDRRLAQVRAESTERDEQVQGAMSRLSGMVAAAPGDVDSSIEAAIRARTADLVEAQVRLTGAQADLRDRLEALTASIASIEARETAELAEPAPTVDPEALVELREELAGLSDAQRDLLVAVEQRHTTLSEALTSGLEDVRMEGTERERDLQHGMSRLSAMVAALRSDLETSIGDAVRFETAAVEQAQEAQWAAQAELTRKLDELAVSMEAGERRLYALESRMEEALSRLSERLERPPVEVPVATPAMGTLLEGLEHQLRAAEGRLAQKAKVQRAELLVGRRYEDAERESVFNQDGRARPVTS